MQAHDTALLSDIYTPSGCPQGAPECHSHIAVTFYRDQVLTKTLCEEVEPKYYSSGEPTRITVSGSTRVSKGS